MAGQQRAFIERYGDRGSFDVTERPHDGHDIAAMPRLVASLVGDTTPDAVVQPRNEQELKNRSPPREHNDHPEEAHELLPSAYNVTLAFRADPLIGDLRSGAH